MLKNYFIVAWRNITRHKIYTGINVLGLALGVSACLVIYLITSYEFSFDTFLPGKERIYRIVGEAQAPDGRKWFLNSIMPDVAGFEHNIPGFESTAAFHLYDAKVTIPQGSKKPAEFNSKGEMIITWPQYFTVFPHVWLAGDSATALNDPYGIVLTESKARQYFGAGAPDKLIGRTVVYDDSLRVTVSGIVKDWDKNSDIAYNQFISISTATSSFLKNQFPTDDWSSLRPHNSMAFVKLGKDATAAQVNERFAAYIKDHVKLDKPGQKLSMWLQPLAELHFTGEFHRGDDGDDFRKAYMPTLYLLMGLALFILLIAAINFINLSTAQSIRRIKEMGVRKVLGGSRRSLVFQFLSETLLLTVFAVIMSALLVRPVLAAFSTFVPYGVAFELFKPSTLIFLLAVTLLTTLLAGFYPARILSAYQPVLSLKGVLSKKTGGTSLRKGLIVFQFTISLLFIVGAIVVGSQVHYMRTAGKGLSTNAIVTINKWRDHSGKLQLLAEQLKHLPGIERVCLQGNSPLGFAHGSENISFKGREPVTLPVSFESGNEDFIPLYEMKLVAGRNIIHSDSLNELVINETGARAFGFRVPADITGHTLYIQDKAYPIVGVVADFHEGSFHDAIQPVVIGRMTEREKSIAIKLPAAKGNDDKVTAGTLAAIQRAWKQVYPATPFSYTFFDESITHLYDQEKKTAWLINLAMCITIFISCMGLFGLIMYTAERRTKEMGIRKVLGASAADITALLSRDFMQLVLIAIVISSPLAWYFMNQWLKDFAYRVDIQWWMFAVAGAGALLITLVTISFHAIRASVANPVKNLRTE